MPHYRIILDMEITEEQATAQVDQKACRPRIHLRMRGLFLSEDRACKFLY